MDEPIRLRLDTRMQELSPHGDIRFPVEIHHDNLGRFYGQFVPCHWHEEWEFSLILRGHPIYQIGEQTRRLSPGDGVLINAGTPHMIPPGSSEPVEYLTLIVHPRFLYGGPDSIIAQQYLLPFCSSPALPALFFHQDGGGWHRLAWDTCLELDRLYTEQPYGYELELKGLLCRLFAAILQNTRSVLDRPENLRRQQRLKQLLTWLHSHYTEKLSLSELAAQISMSREACCRLFRQAVGMTISQYLAEYRVVQSLPLLDSGSHSILEVAEMVGFSNASRYAAAFRQRFGCPPGAYLLHRQQASSPLSASSRADML